MTRLLSTDDRLSCMSTIVRVGTRGSALALRQTDIMIGRLRAVAPGHDFEIVTLETRADRDLTRSIAAFGDKGVFVRRFEAALRSGEIDLAVHSLKDVPGDEEPEDLGLVAFSPRADPRDVLVSRGSDLAGLPAGAVVGTSSPRRRVQLLTVRPDVVPREIRGNVDTRIRKVESGEYDAAILAAAGLERLGLLGRIAEFLPPRRFVPDAGQGIIALQARLGDTIGDTARSASDPASAIAAQAERAVVRALGAGCRSPVGAYAILDGDAVQLLGMAASEDGQIVRYAEVVGRSQDAAALGVDLAAKLTRLLAA